MERLVVIWCPSLLTEGDRGEEARAFDRVLEAAGVLCPWVEPVRLGVCALPARGPTRFFGGEAAVVAEMSTAVSTALGVTAPDDPDTDGPPAFGVGVADGLFAGTLAARSGLIVERGGTPGFLAPWSVAVLQRPELAVTLQRLGIRTLGQLASLPERHVLARFDADALTCHRVARGEEGELPGQRDPGITRRLQVVRGDVAEAARQPGFFGGASAADVRAAAAITRAQARLNPGDVVVGRLQGGRGPIERARLVPWGSHEASGGGQGLCRAEPWPGTLPPPSPAVVLSSPAPAEVSDADARPVRVTGRGLFTAEPALVSVDGGPWEDVIGWAGPWPASERWWSARRRRARLQVVTVPPPAAATPGRQVARLLVAERGRWWVEAIYD